MPRTSNCPRGDRLQGGEEPRPRAGQVDPHPGARARPAGDLWLGIGTSVELSALTLVEPDLVVYPKHFQLREVRGPDILLAIEVADTSFKFDRGRKAQLYAAHGVRELWVVEANTRAAFVHRGLTALGWGNVIEVPSTHALEPGSLELSRFSVRLADLD